VPNSQLIIVPGPKWILETYISPTVVIGYLLVAVVIVLGLIGLWVTRLTRREKI
jgi:MFS-type transporter involved in bile tolerance (Atg22 family)